MSRHLLFFCRVDKLKCSAPLIGGGAFQFKVPGHTANKNIFTTVFPNGMELNNYGQQLKRQCPMSNIVPLTFDRHRKCGWHRFTSYAFAAGNHIAPLVAAELHRATLSMPLAFARLENRYIFSAVLSPKAGENLFVDASGRWIGAYIPWCFRSYPFSSARVSNSDRLVLCVDESSRLITENGGEPFFDEKGKLAAPVKNVLEFLQKVARNRSMTDQAVAALADSRVLLPWNLLLKQESVEYQSKGLYRIDEEKLWHLDDNTFLKLRKTDALPIVYGQLLSMRNTRFFPRLDQMRAQAEGQVAQDSPNLEKIFGEDDIFKF